MRTRITALIIVSTLLSILISCRLDVTPQNSGDGSSSMNSSQQHSSEALHGSLTDSETLFSTDHITSDESGEEPSAGVSNSTTSIIASSSKVQSSSASYGSSEIHSSNAVSSAGSTGSTASQASSAASNSQDVGFTTPIPIDTTTINRGALSLQGDWTYFSGMGYSGICKTRNDGTGATSFLKTETISKFHIENEWIYYIGNRYNICKVRTDGTGNEIIRESTEGIIESRVDYIYVEGDWVYYHMYYYGYFKMRTDGRFIKLIGSDRSMLYNQFIAIDNACIYYSDTGGIRRIGSNGTEKRFIINAHIGAGFQLADNYIYYRLTTDTNLYRASIGQIADEYIDSENIRFLEESLSIFRMADGWMYYCNVSDFGKLYKIRMDGTGKTLLYNNEYDMIGSFDVAGDWIYFDAYDHGRIKTDGSQLQKISEIGLH